MLGRLTAEQTQREMQVMLATNERRLKDEAVDDLQRDLSEAIRGERSKRGGRLPPGEAASLFNVRPPEGAKPVLWTPPSAEEHEKRNRILGGK